jgi:hypothetical protein
MLQLHRRAGPNNRNEVWAPRSCYKKRTPPRQKGLNHAHLFEVRIEEDQMTARLTKKTEHENTAPESPSQRKQLEGRFRLQVDRQTKSTYATFEAAEAAGMAIKKNHPLVHVGVYDHLESVNKVIQLPEA